MLFSIICAYEWNMVGQKAEDYEEGRIWNRMIMKGGGISL